MIKHYVDIDGKWAVILAYDIGRDDLDEVSAWLDALGANEREIARARRVAMATNSGFTFSDPTLRMSVVCVSQATSPDQWWDTMVHELKHVQSHVCQHYHVAEDSEDAAYLIGYLMRQIWRKTAKMRQKKQIF